MSTEDGSPNAPAPLPGPLAGGLPEARARELRLPPVPVEAAEAYRERVRQTFRSLKSIEDAGELARASIPLGPADEEAAPLCALHLHDEELIAELARWREQNASAYPSRFKVTVEGTAAWLRGLLDTDGRILFLALGDERPIGHLSFADAINDGCEISFYNWIRGVQGIRSGIMNRLCASLIAWSDRTVRPRRIIATPFDDNPVMADLARNGFRVIARLPMRRHEDEGRIEYRYIGEDDPRPADKIHLFMAYTPAASGDVTAPPSTSAGR